MGPERRINIVFRNELANAKDAGRRARRGWPKTIARNSRIPFKAAELGYIDEVIMPRDTRPKLIGALKALVNKREKNPPRKHGNIPL